MLSDFMCVHGEDELARCEEMFEKAVEILSEDFHTENLTDIGFVNLAVIYLGSVNLSGDQWFLVWDNNVGDNRSFSIECDYIVHGLARAIVHEASLE